MPKLKRGDTVYISVGNRPSNCCFVLKAGKKFITTSDGKVYHAEKQPDGSRRCVYLHERTRLLWDDQDVARLNEWKWDIRRQVVDHVARYVWLPGTTDDQVAEMADLLGVKLLERPGAADIGGGAT